VKDITRANFIK